MRGRGREQPIASTNQSSPCQHPCSPAAPLRLVPPGIFLFFSLSASYKELFNPRYRHTEQAFILGQRERGGWGASVTLETRELTDSRAKPATSFSHYWSKALSISNSFLSLPPMAALSLRFGCFFSSDSFGAETRLRFRDAVLPLHDNY